jgi:hypothetical protein
MQAHYCRNNVAGESKMTCKVSLTKTQHAIAKMVTNAIGFSWTSYNNADRSVARNLLLRHISTAPEKLSQRDWARMMEGKGKKYTKDCLRSLSDALKDDIWRVL